LAVVSGTAEEAAEKVIFGRKLDLSGWKPHWKQASYRSGEPLRHPKSSATSNFSASCEAVPYPSRPFLKQIDCGIAKAIP